MMRILSYILEGWKSWTCHRFVWLRSRGLHGLLGDIVPQDSCSLPCWTIETRARVRSMVNRVLAVRRSSSTTELFRVSTWVNLNDLQYVELCCWYERSYPSSSSAGCFDSERSVRFAYLLVQLSVISWLSCTTTIKGEFSVLFISLFSVYDVNYCLIKQILLIEFIVCDLNSNQLNPWIYNRQTFHLITTPYLC